MESPPPVPPKDPPYDRRMAVDHEDRPSTSGSKRKRTSVGNGASNDGPALHQSLYEMSEQDGQPSAKKSRSAAPSDMDTSDEATPAVSRSVKRKKKVNNLSTLSLRHAPHEQPDSERHTTGSPRESRFQEGSLTDKPSGKPPSAFTRLPRTDSGNLHIVDTLMSDYHDGILAPESAADAIAREKAQIPARVERITAEAATRENGGGLFTFGRSLAGSFHPINLWNKLWSQSKEELTRQNQEEAARKASQKAQAEAKYAEMKRTGLFGLHPLISLEQSEDEDQPRDSAVGFDDGREMAEEEYYTSSGLLPPARDSASRASKHGLDDKTIKPGKGFRSRLTLKRPSLANLRNALRPARSDYNLGDKAAASSSSISPVKRDFDMSTVSTVRNSASKYDLKKTHKLSKRVSDLELKLQQARRDLDSALVEASPMPKMNSRYERFTPSGSFRGNKFKPGKLPRLDSERILLAELAANDAQVVSRTAMELTDEMIEGEPSDEDAVKTVRRRQQDIVTFRHAPVDPASDAFDEDQETLKAARPLSYPPRASSVFSPIVPTNSTPEISKMAQIESDRPEDADQGVNTDADVPTANGTMQTTTASYSVLDAKLKALNNQHKALMKQKKPTKRKSRGGDDEKDYRPDGGLDDEAEWQEATRTPPKKKKKHKSSEKTTDSPGTKRAKKTPNSVEVESSPAEVEEEMIQFSSPLSTMQPVTSGKENRLSMSKRISMDSQLEPLYEEEEEVAVAVTLDSFKPVVKSTPAKPASQIPRSVSPYKSTPVEDAIMSRAGEAAQEQRKGRSTARSNPTFEWPDDVF